jgi:hypothetical protein
MSPQPAGARDCPICRIIHVPPTLDTLFQPLEQPSYWNYCTYFRWLVVTIAFMWGRRHVATVYRYLDTPSYRTHVHNFFLVERWDPEEVLRQQAQAWLWTLHPEPRETISLRIDNSKNATWGLCIEAVATRQDPAADAFMQGHQQVCVMLVCRDQVIPWDIRL